MEIWKDIKGYEGIYQVSNTGRIRSLLFNKQKTLKGSMNSEGYLTVRLKGKTYHIHRIVAETFIPNPDNKPEVDHIIPIMNGGTNDVNNLRWVTGKENVNNKLSIINKSGKNHPFYNKKGAESQYSKKVARYDYQMNLIDVWIGISDAQRILRIYHIADACSGKRNSAGKDENGNPYYWRYIE